MGYVPVTFVVVVIDDVHQEIECETLKIASFEDGLDQKRNENYSAVVVRAGQEYFVLKYICTL